MTALAKPMPLPRAVVVDVGVNADRGWAVIEFNAALSAGLDGCDPEMTLPLIVAAAAPSAR